MSSTNAVIEMIEICEIGEIPASGKLCREINGRKILIVRTESGVHVVSALCTHELFEMTDGSVVLDTIECPLHGAVFNLVTGEVEFGPAESPLAIFESRIEGDLVFASIPNGGVR
jgi:3-phenylpropionate/trans-cinnamate dioxygenase ferredoxin subunit